MFLVMVLATYLVSSQLQSLCIHFTTKESFQCHPSDSDAGGIPPSIKHGGAR